ncbi:hypothetical protein EYF80_003393 [Liparis tanakae]|uniref:Uncharacterized protein n=1 Tax=Liparis tanakae TaxID=230148 RepID=A0A4Z2J9F3_9TELE|nr:hypothetical protein EYF80_003393 [Liparis tanakae]
MTSEGVVTPENSAKDSGNVGVVAFGSFGVLTDSFLSHNSHMTHKQARLSFLPNRSYSDNGRTILANEQESQDSLGPL